MEEKQAEVSFKSQLEEAERKGREEGHNKGMADMFALLSAADASEHQRLYFRHEYLGDDDYFRVRVTNAMLNAASQTQNDLTLFFLKAGADINAFDDNLLNVLQYAVLKSDTELIDTLLESGADPNLIYDNNYFHCYDYQTPVALAVKQGNIEIVKTLLAAGADVNIGYNINKPEEKGPWLLKYHAPGDQVEMTQLLLDAGAYIGPDVIRNFKTPLMSAAYSAKAKAAALLLEAGCDVNGQDVNGRSVLMKAAMGGNEGALDTIRLLLKSGAEINYKDKKGRTALMWAANRGHSEAVGLLLSAGADVFFRAKASEMRQEQSAWNGRNAFDVADGDAVKELIKNEMHRRIAAALSALPDLPVGLRQKIVQLYVEHHGLYE